MFRLADKFRVLRLKFSYHEIQSIPVTGEISIADQNAAGSAIFRGNPSKDQITVPAGTIVSTAGDLPIRFQTDIEGILGGGRYATVSIPVTALSPGGEGNIPANSLEVIESGLDAALKVSNLEPYSGGKVSKYPSPGEADRVALHKIVLSEIERKGTEQARTEYGSQYWIVPGSFSIIKSETENYYPPDGEQGDTLTFESTGTASILVVGQADLIAFIQQVFRSDPSADNTVLPGSIIIVGLSPEGNKNNSSDRVILSANLTKIPQIELGSLSYQLAGSPIGQVQERILKRIPVSRSIVVENHPSWWPWVAALPMQIRIELR